MESLPPMGGWVDGHFDIFLKPPQPFIGLFLNLISGHREKVINAHMCSKYCLET